MTRKRDARPDDEDFGDDEQQKEILSKLPDRASADQERGERHATGKAIATGGKSATGSKTTETSSESPDDDSERDDSE